MRSPKGTASSFLRFSPMLLTLLLAIGLVSILPVLAQTADDETPAEESVCDEAGLTGALNGLCVAYCEAMDCDSDEPHASASACEKVKVKFEQITDGSLPCEICPCYTVDALVDLEMDTCYQWEESETLILINSVTGRNGLTDVINPGTSNENVGCSFSFVGGGVSFQTTQREFDLCNQTIREAAELLGVFCPSF